MKHPKKKGRNPLLRLNARYPVVTLVAVFFGGIVLWGGFNTAMEMTNSNSFCISCHEMEQNAYQDYIKTGHFKNPAGVRAGCPDCHVPRDWSHMLIRKIGASAEIYHKLRGTIDTPEKYLERQPELAKKVWKTMKESDSRECRNCHNFAFMDEEGQNDKARKAHNEGQEKRHTCIDCHRGVMHALSDELLEEAHKHYEKDGVNCALCHTGMARASDDEEWD